jgi:uncharacterized membrane protein
MNVLLWILQVLLAALFLFAGGTKLVLPADQLAGPVAFPLWFLRFIGVVEVLGALGLLLPGIFRIRKRLTPLAACGLVILMMGAVPIGIMAGGVMFAAIPGVVGILAAFIAFGRWKTWK